MINSVYAQFSFGFLVLCGVFIIFKRSREHGLMWVALALYWIISGVVQVQTGANSIPKVTIPLCILVTAAAVYSSKQTLTYWPLVIAGLMVTTVLANVFYASHNITHDNPTFRVRRLHQDLTAAMFYLSLVCLSAHPKAGARNGLEERFSYC